MLHGFELVDGLVRHDAHPLDVHVLQVHADLLSGARPEADRGSSHLKGVFLELRLVVGRRIATPRLLVGELGHGRRHMVVVMARVGVTWTVWRMRVLHCPQEVCRPGSFLSGSQMSCLCCFVPSQSQVNLRWAQPELLTRSSCLNIVKVTRQLASDEKENKKTQTEKKHSRYLEISREMIIRFSTCYGDLIRGGFSSFSAPEQ